MSRDDRVSFPGGYEERREEMVPMNRSVDESINKAIRASVPEGGMIRGSVMCEALHTINGQRQDSYGNPENSFGRIALLFTAYLKGKYGFKHDLTNEDVALLMTEMKIARMMTGSGHRDSYVDAAGYIGLAADMCCEVKDV